MQRAISRDRDGAKDERRNDIRTPGLIRMPEAEELESVG
jgi:hypothetical protein